jgi:SAM-dependent methyltransferase
MSNDILREVIQRREVYTPHWPTEEFIVPILRSKLEEILDNYYSPEKLNALDVGCGGQPLRIKLEALGYKYTGFDITQNITNTVDFIGAIDRDLPQEVLNLDKFDLILCTEVLEHVANWEQAFFNLSKLTSPNGIIIITCPHFLQLHEEPHDYWRPTLYAIDYYARKNGLSVIYQEKAGDAWDVLGTLLASCWTFPASINFVDRLFTKVVSIIRAGMFKIIKSRFLQKKVKLMGPLYLLNIAILKK